MENVELLFVVNLPNTNLFDYVNFAETNCWNIVLKIHGESVHHHSCLVRI